MSGAESPRNRTSLLRAVAIATATLVIVVAGAAVTGVEVVTHQPPPKLTVAQVVAKVRPSVVTIKATIFRDGASEGQGFLFGGGGHVLTSAHVLEHSTKISVVNARGETSSAALVGLDKSRDVAELLTSDRKTSPLVVASSSVAVGAQVVVVGNLYSALPYSVHSGRVTGTAGRVGLKSQTIAGLIETDASAHVANSGGPIVNMSGELVGMLVPSDSGRAFALPVSEFAAEAKSWAKEDKPAPIGPPMVTQSAPSLIPTGVPLDGFVQANSEPWTGYGIHVVYIRAPTHDYGGAAIDIFLEVVPNEADAGYVFTVSGSIDRGFSQVASSSALGDQTVFLQRIASNQVTYEVAWRDRNVNVYMYLGSGRPEAPDVSLQTLIALAVQQEETIAANLQDW